MSNYPGFEVKIDDDNGSTTLLPLQTVKVYDVTNSTALADIASDANGLVAPGSLAVAVGTRIRFSFSRADGICGFSEVLTT